MNRLSHFCRRYLYDPGRSVESVGVNVGLLVLRVTFGFSLLFVHGLGKLTSFGAEAATFDNPIGLGPV